MAAGKAVETAAATPMDWMTFVASIVGSVAWPIAVFAVALLFRTQLRHLLERIKRLSVGENSVDFTERLDEAEAVMETEAVSTPADSEQSSAVLAPSDERILKLIELSPSAAVLDTWQAVERKIRDTASNADGGEVSEHYMPTALAIRSLANRRRISKGTYALLSELQQLRNAAAHSQEVSTADAVRFAQLARKALFFLDGPDVRPDNPDKAN